MNDLELHESLRGVYQLRPPSTDSGPRDDRRYLVLIDTHESAQPQGVTGCLLWILNGDQRVTKDHGDEPLYFKMLGGENVRSKEWDDLRACQPG